jgi:GTP-binding protein Era
MTTSVKPAASGAATRAGYVTLAGRPNAGKSSLLNAFLGEKLSIVSPRAQTTWESVTGIVSEDGVQMVFLDTPGLLDPGDLLQRSMISSATAALREADLILLVVDASVPLTERDRRLLAAALAGGEAPRFLALNKVDVATPESVEGLATWGEAELGARVHRVSALTGLGVQELRDALAADLPLGPFLFPDDEIASAPVRFFVAEMVRETVFEQFHQEIPYAVAARVEEFREAERPVYIQVTLYVERDSQRRILVGAGGAAIRNLGATARKKIEDLLQERVYLDLWVKVLPGWRRKHRELGRLGYRIPDDDHSSD